MTNSLRQYQLVPELPRLSGHSRAQRHTRAQLTYQLAYAAHSISQKFEPDNVGELIYQGVASTALHSDLDNTLQGDLTYQLGAHALSAGFYLGEYGVEADDNSLVFPTAGGQPDRPPFHPVRVINNANKINILSGIYVGDPWQIAEKLRVNIGLRWDRLSGFTVQQPNRSDDQSGLPAAQGYDAARRVRALYAGAEFPGNFARSARRV